MEILKTKCVIVGHLHHELQGGGVADHPESIEIQDKLRKKLIELIEGGTTYFYCGMELGVELWAGEILLVLKEDYPQIKIHSVIASEERANDWSEEDRERYFDEVLPNCDEETYTSVRNDDEALPYRNSYLSKQADLFLAVWNGGETCHTADLVRKVEKLGKEIILIRL